MTTKKAIIIGTLCAIGISLTAYAIKKGINIKPKTMSAVNADSLYTEKNMINTESLSDGWQYNVRPTALNENNQTFWTNPETLTAPYQSLENTTWSITSFNAILTTKNINFTSANTNFTNIKVERSTAPIVYTLWYNNTVAGYYRNGTYSWANIAYTQISITNGNSVEDTTLINYLTNHANLLNGTLDKEETFLANKRYENYTSTYLGIEYVMMSQKTFHNNKVKNETLFFIKLQSTGITRQLFLEDAAFYTTIPNMELNGTYPTYNAQFKMSKMTSMNITESTNLWQEKGSFLNKYNSIQNKTNIYSVDAYASGTSINLQENITYTNETGTAGTATFGHAIASSTNTSMWTIHQDTNIYSQARANYVVIYFNCEVSNFNTINEQDHPNWYKYLYQYVGATTQFNGYGVSSNPVTPPDIENGNFMSLTDMILNILSLPFTFLSQAFDLTLWANTPWAFNIKNAIFVLVGILTFLFIIKLFTRGFDTLGNYTGSISRNRANRSQRKLNKEKAKLAKRTDPNTKTRINKKE